MPIPPTEENLLEDVRKFVSEPAKWARERGALVAIRGGFNCPWCGAPCKELEETYIAVCTRSPIHIVEWRVWGG